MARILFLQNVWYDSLGAMCLSAYLKKNGHKTDVIIGEVKSNYAEIKAFAPHIFAFSVSTGDQHWALEKAKMLKEKFGAITVFGGPHPTYFPEMIEKPQVDIVVRGEGEGALLEIADCIDDNKQMFNIKNIWIKDGEKVYRNELRDLIQDLDMLPFADREIFYKYKYLLNSKFRQVLSGRGCPFSCSYCYNSKLKELYKGKGKYLRRQSPSRTIAELEYIQKRFGAELFVFSDDIFPLNKKWLFEFLELYRQKSLAKFVCNVQAATVDEEMIKELKESGCHQVLFGLESGNQCIRKNILNKNISDDQIIETAKLLKKYNLEFMTYNILGIPGETLENAYETVKLNIKIKTDHPWVSIMQPYPGTGIAKYAQENQMIGEIDVDKFLPSYFDSSVFKHKDISQIENLHKFFYFAVKMPALLPIIKVLVRFPPNIFYRWIFILGYGLRYMRSHKLGIFDAFSIAVHSGFLWKRKQ